MIQLRAGMSLSFEMKESEWGSGVLRPMLRKSAKAAVPYRLITMRKYKNEPHIIASQFSEGNLQTAFIVIV